jgi:large subunit ribosomal protein L30
VKFRVMQLRSGIGQSQRQRDTLRGLGLNRIRSERVLLDTPAIRGMLDKVKHLVEWEQVDE